MKLRLGLGFSTSLGSPGRPPTQIFLSPSSAPEDLALGMAIGFLTNDGNVPVTYSLEDNPDGKFNVFEGKDELTLVSGFDFENAQEHDVTIRATFGDDFIEQPFTITVEDVDEDEDTPLPVEEITPVYSGDFEVTPVITKGNGKTKGQGKVSSIATLILSIGAATAGATYIARVDPDFSLLSNGGKDAMVGWGFKENNDFHIVGLKGNGSTGLNKAKIHGNWNGLNGATITTNGAPANGTQAGPNWIKIEIAADGSTYTFSTGTGADVGSVVWTVEYTAATPTPLDNADDALQFGIAAFFPATDIGQFSIEIDVWEVIESDPYWANVTFLSGFEGADASTTFDDESDSNNSVTAAGDAQIDTAQKKFGNSSLLLDGTGDYLAAGSSSDPDFTTSNGTTPFTMEAFIRFSGLSATTYDIVSARSPGASGYSFKYDHNAHALRFSIEFQSTCEGSWTASANVWYHVATDFDGTKQRLYVDGVMVGSLTASRQLSPAGNGLAIGAQNVPNGGEPFLGWLDEVRITKGVARYASDGGFSPPTKAFPRG